MKILLDTCAILWAVASPAELSPRAKKSLLDKESEILVSPMSCSEIACLVDNKRITLDRHWKLWFRNFVEENGWTVMPIDLPIVEEAYSLPGNFHRDPADRILVATTRLFQASILTADRRILEYPHVPSIW